MGFKKLVGSIAVMGVLLSAASQSLAVQRLMRSPKNHTGVSRIDETLCRFNVPTKDLRVGDHVVPKNVMIGSSSFPVPNTPAARIVAISAGENGMDISLAYGRNKPIESGWLSYDGKFTVVKKGKLNEYNKSTKRVSEQLKTFFNFNVPIENLQVGDTFIPANVPLGAASIPVPNTRAARIVAISPGENGMDISYVYGRNKTVQTGQIGYNSNVTVVKKGKIKEYNNTLE